MSAQQPEFTFPVDVTALSPSGRHYEIKADEAARARVAARLGLAGISSLAARFDLVPRAGGIVKITGVVESSLTQTCVVTLVPVPATVREEIETRFSIAAPAKTPARATGKSGAKAEKEAEELLDLSGEEPPEDAQDGQIDLGELAVVQLALGLDPYPRAPGAAFAPVSLGEKGEKTVTESPFGVLAKFKPKSPPAKGG